MSLVISGPKASAFRAALQLLSENQLPEDWTPVASSSNAHVAHNEAMRAYFKEFLPRNKFESIKAWLRGSRCQRARLQSEQLAAAGFNTPACLCWGKLGNNREFLITEASTGTGVTEYLRKQLNTDKNPTGLKLKRHFLGELGATIGRLHNSGIVHGDLRTSNVLTRRDDSQFQFCFIDNERNSQHSIIPLKLVKKNLVQLNMLLPEDLTLSDRWRFFLRYCEAYPRFSKQHARQLATSSYQTAMGRLRKKGKL